MLSLINLEIDDEAVRFDSADPLRTIRYVVNRAALYPAALTNLVTSCLDMVAANRPTVTALSNAITAAITAAGGNLKTDPAPNDGTAIFLEKADMYALFSKG